MKGSTHAHENTDALASLIESTVLCDRSAFRRTVSYAIENSMSALHNASCNALTEPASHIHAVFDWFVALARAFRSVPTGTFISNGDGIRVSKDVVFSLSILAEYQPGLVLRFRETYDDDTKHRCDEETVRVLREVNLEGELVRQVIAGDFFQNIGPFSSGKAFVGYALMHARNIGSPLVTMELLYDSIFTPWEMDIRENVAPWERSWRSREEYFISWRRLLDKTVTFRGQRKTARLFLDRVEDVAPGLGAALRGELSPTNAIFRAVWTLGGGTDSTVRSALLTGKKAPMWSPWASCLIPWLSPTFVEAALKNGNPTREGVRGDTSRRHKIERVRDVVRIAAVVDSSPEAHELCFEAWLECTKRPHHAMRRNPHLVHVTEKIKRYVRRYKPPDVLCESIVDEAEAYASKFERKNDYFQAEEVLEARETPPPTVKTVARRLREDGNFYAADLVEEFVVARPINDVYVFDDRSTVSWIDVTFSRATIWSDMVQKGEIVAVRGANHHFILSTRKYGIPRVRKHPLTDLTREEWSSHPLQSPRTEILVACV